MKLPNHALLAAWLKTRGMKAGAFGKMIPISKDVIGPILNGKRAPREEVAKKIEQLTGGDVPADKWQKGPLK